MTRRFVVVLLTLGALTGLTACAQGREEIKTIDGQQFICSWTQLPLGEKQNYACRARWDGSE